MLLLGSVVALGTGWLVINPEPVAASVFDGKTCATAPLYLLKTCPAGRGVVDLTSAQTIVIPNGAQCFDSTDPLGESTSEKYACNYDTDPGGEAENALAASQLRDEWIQKWKDQNSGNPTEGQWMMLLNETVGSELEGPVGGGDDDKPCDTLSGYNKIRCEAIQACEAAGGDSECTSQFDVCMDGSTDEDQATTCADEIAPA